MKILSQLDGAKMIKQDSENQFVTQKEKDLWNKKLERSDVQPIFDIIENVKLYDTIEYPVKMKDIDASDILDVDGNAIIGRRIYELK